jgi:hypothetical protein
MLLDFFFFLLSFCNVSCLYTILVVDLLFVSTVTRLLFSCKVRTASQLSIQYSHLRRYGNMSLSRATKIPIYYLDAFHVCTSSAYKQELGTAWPTLQRATPAAGSAHSLIYWSLRFKRLSRKVCLLQLQECTELHLHSPIRLHDIPLYFTSE